MKLCVSAEAVYTPGHLCTTISQADYLYQILKALDITLKFNNLLLCYHNTALVCMPHQLYYYSNQIM
jgi:hypothetical protein